MSVVLILCLVLLGDSTTGAETECGQPQRVHGALPKPEYRDVSSFAHNATIEYRCDVTHYLVDLTSWFRTCLNGKWDDVQFRCIAKTCPALTTPNNGQRVGSDHEVGTFAKFQCNDGYEMMGVAQLLCRTDVEWSPKYPPTCKPVRCRDDSYLANGRVFQETFRQEENTYGITNRYSCNTGYDIKGPSVRTCQADKTWSGIQPICDMPRCPEIIAENGEVEYMGERARYTYAFITCDKGYSFGKDGVETVECLRILQWDNTLHCYKTVESWNPENSFTRNLKDKTVEHNEEYTIRCSWGYEMKQNNGNYLGGNTRRTMSISVKNMYGTLKHGEMDAVTLSCVKKRCFQKDINLESTSKVIVRPNRKYVEHGQSFHLSCENGYEDRLESSPDLVCNYGKLEGKQPQCTPKRCFQMDFKVGSTSNVIVQPNRKYVEHGQSFHLSCENGYEDRLESDPNLMCNYGELEGELPNCEPKRCFKKDIKLGSTSKVIVRPNRTYVEHGQSFHLSCENGYEDRLESDPDLMCNYGNLEGKQPQCEPKPCLTPTIENGKLNRSTRSEYSKATIISGHSVSVSCEDNFFLYDNSKKNFTTKRSMPITCKLGNMTPIPSCKKASKCEFPDDPFASYYVNGDNITGVNTISHEVKVKVKCENGTKITAFPEVRTCWDGAWTPGKQLPVCEPESCHVYKEKGRRFFDGREVIGDVAHGQTVTVVCDIGFDIIGNAYGANSEIRCHKGQFDNMYQCVERCAIPEIPKANITRLNGTSTEELKHGEMVSASCEENFFLYDNSKNNFTTERSMSISCEQGNMTSIPSCRNALKCELPDDRYASYYVNGDKIIGENTTLHEIEVRVVCESGTNITVSSDVIRCWNGAWISDKQFPICEPGCAIPVIPNANITRLNGTSTTKLKHGEMITVTCSKGPSLQSEEYIMSYEDYVNDKYPDSIFTCNGSTITGLSNNTCEISQDSMVTTEKPRSAATAETNATTATATTTNNTTEISTRNDTTPVSGVLNCTIPASGDVVFITLSGDTLIEGTEIHNGRQIIAEKECKDYYAGYYYAFYNDGDDVEESSPKKTRVYKKVNCSQGSLSDYTLVCDDVETPDIANSIPDKCRTLPNGNVTDNGQSFECNEGYVNADSLLYERYSCSCDRDIPALVCNGRQAKCEPINCKLNSPIEQGMTLKYKGTFITASTIEAIDHGGSVIFDCEIGANEVAYEPKNRMFKCDRGNWIEHNRNGAWSLGNIGTFPKCRTAKCNCRHGGTCIRDETCVCSTFSTGAQCETPICHGGCQNGGSCTSPNKCRCPNGFSGNSCETKGCGAPFENKDDRIYQIGAKYTVTRNSCSHGNIPSYEGQITCDNGHWSEQITCLNGTRYSIRAKTDDTKWFSGTDEEVYLYMFGSKGSSGKIVLNGEFESGNVDFTDDHFVDVGEIFHIRLGVKAKSLANDGWKPESVLIEDVSRRAYYKFVHDLTEIQDTSIILYPVASCNPPKDLKKLRSIYFVGDELSLTQSNCAQGYKPEPSFTKCTKGGWTADVICVQRSTYRIRVKTVEHWQDPWSRTSQKVFVRIHGSKTNTNWKQISGNFGPGRIAEKRYVLENIGQIKHIFLSASGTDLPLSERWKPDYVTIHVEDTDDLYVFRYNRPDYLFNNRTVLIPEGHCSTPFINHRHKVVAPTSAFLEEKRANDITDCKIQCIEDHRCKMAMFSTQYCRRYSDGNTNRRQNSNWIAYNLDSCYGRH